MVTETRLADIVGKANVSSDLDYRRSFATDQSFVRKMLPQFVVKATTMETVQQLVKLANETVTPLIPVSSEGPHFYGDTVPSTGDAVILDLTGMKEIDLIDRDERVVCGIGAGVTFGELIPAVAEKGMRLNMPLAPRKTKSVVASMLCREPVIMPRYHWDIADPIGSTEVIFGTGDMFRTGSAAGPGGIAEQRESGGRQKEAAGPSAMSLHRVIQGSQGTMGVVTWAASKLELLPVKEEPYFIGASDPAKLLDVAYWLLRLRLGNELLIMNKADVAALLSPDGASAARLAAKLPAYVLFYNLAAYDYLPELKMEGQTKDVQELLQRLGAVAVQTLGGVSAKDFLEAIRKPSDDPYWKLRGAGGCQDIFCISTYPKIPGLIKVMTEAADKVGYSAAKMGVYIQPIVQGANIHVEFNLFYDPSDPVETAAVRELATSTISPLMNAGGFFSRPFGEAARDIMNRDAATVEALKKVKAILDPVGILNPGKLCF